MAGFLLHSFGVFNDDGFVVLNDAYLRFSCMPRMLRFSECLRNGLRFAVLVAGSALESQLNRAGS
jgi:hypothetical protein